MNKLIVNDEFILNINDIYYITLNPNQIYYYEENNMGSISIYIKMSMITQPVGIGDIKKEYFYNQIGHIIRNTIIDNILE